MKITSDENVNQAVEQMVQAIRNTDAYLEYQKQLARVKEQSELRDRSMNSGPEILNCRPARTPTLISWISLPENEAFRENPLVSDFLAAGSWHFAV